MSISILVVDDDPYIRDLFTKELRSWGYEVDTVGDGRQALSMVMQKPYHIVFADLVLPGLSGQKLVQKIKNERPDTEVMVITGQASIEDAVEAMKASAFDFILKPLNFDHIKVLIDRCLEKIGLKEEGTKLKNIADDLSNVAFEKYHYGKLIGKNHRMQEIYGLINTLKDIDSTVLITGETGTGKGLLARTIHYNSTRCNNAFITVDCGAIPETLLESELFGYEKGAFTGALRRRLGKFEQAHKGTIFMDEVGDIPLPTQQKLLRVIQERVIERLGGETSINVDVRIIAATNRDLKKMVEEGTFREDLYYRLNIIPIHLPPLRERMDDLVLLVTHFMETYREKLKKDVRTISQDALNAMMRYHWPGNIRELENLMERAIIMTPGKDITKMDIPGERRNKDIYSFGKIDTNLPLKQVKREIIEQVERKYLKELLKKNRGNINQVARQAKIDNKTLYEKMKKFNYRKEDFKRLSIDEKLGRL
jgi:DNA-binding NtrC family response regulator